MSESPEAYRHRRFLCASFFALGVGGLLFTAVMPSSFPYVFFLRLLGNIGGLLFLTTGYALYTNAHWTHQIAMPTALLSALNVPVGTGLAIYYFWYHRTYVEPQT